MSLLRGQVIRVKLDHLGEAKLYLVVSNNRRNAHLGSVLTARLTTTNKKPRPSIVELPPHEGFTGRIVCDDIMVVYDDEVTAVMGGLTPATMRLVDRGLAEALDLP